MIGGERINERTTEAAGKTRQRPAKRQQAPEVYQVVIECRDEAEQRELWERMKGEGRRVRLLVI